MGSILRPGPVGAVVVETVQPFIDALPEGHRLAVLVLDTSQEEFDGVVPADQAAEGPGDPEDDAVDANWSGGFLTLGHIYVGPGQIEDDVGGLTEVAYEIAITRRLTSQQLYGDHAGDLAEDDPLPKNGLAWTIHGDLVIIVVSMDISLSEQVVELVRDAVIKCAKDRLADLDGKEGILLVGDEETVDGVEP